MHKKMFVSLLMVLVLILSIAPMGIQAQENTKDDLLEIAEELASEFNVSLEEMMMVLSSNIFEYTQEAADDAISSRLRTGELSSFDTVTNTVQLAHLIY